MIYNENKTREMLRSILPSTGRTAARHSKKEAKRTARTNINQALREHGAEAVEMPATPHRVWRAIHGADASD